MKKTLNVNIASQAFTIDEDAYDVLKGYYEDIRSRIYEVDRKEILEDVELRTADIFRENLSFPSQVVSNDIVKRAIAIIGSAHSFGEKKYDRGYTKGKSETPPQRKLYRSRTDSVIGGVCGGLANYLNVDATVIRLLTFFLVFFGGLSLWIYIILWIFVPLAPVGYSNKGASDKRSTGGRV